VLQKKTILIVDEHPVFREGLKVLIAREAGYEMVGEAGTGTGCWTIFTMNLYSMYVSTVTARFPIGMATRYPGKGRR